LWAFVHILGRHSLPRSEIFCIRMVISDGIYQTLMGGLEDSEWIRLLWLVGLGHFDLPFLGVHVIKIPFLLRTSDAYPYVTTMVRSTRKFFHMVNEKSHLSGINENQ
jgi:hypothetical protein